MLVRVRAVSLNRGDFYTVAGRPWLVRLSGGLVRPKEPRVGWDFAGTVEAVGASEPNLRVNDEVFGVRPGAFGEYLTVSDGVAPKPANLSFEEAAASRARAVFRLSAHPSGWNRPSKRLGSDPNYRRVPSQLRRSARYPGLSIWPHTRLDASVSASQPPPAEASVLGNPSRC